MNKLDLPPVKRPEILGSGYVNFKRNPETRDVKVFDTSYGYGYYRVKSSDREL